MDAVGRLVEYSDDWLFGLAWPLPLLVIVATMVVFALIALKRRSLDPSGAIAAAIMGVVVLWTTKIEGLLLLLLFFVGANMVGKVSKRIQSNPSNGCAGHIGGCIGGKEPCAAGNGIEGNGIEKKGSRRDLMQVLANGLMAMVAGLIWYVCGSFPALVMFGASIAEAAADTFAGEVGRLSKNPPVSIRTLAPVPKGLSGGVTLLGMIASFAASMGIGLCWLALFDAGRSFVAASVICLTGFMGSIVDSYLGACVQAQYRDPHTGMLTEREFGDGRPFELVRGVRWVDNDMVNLLSNVFSAVFAFGMAAILL